MTNTVDVMKPTYWSDRFQTNLRVKNISREITSNEEQSNLFDGKTVNRPTVSRGVIGNVGADGSFSPNAVTSTQESLTVDNHQYAAFTITDAEAIQIKNSPRLVNEMIDDGSYQLNLALDRSIFGEYVNSDAANTVTPAVTAGRFDNAFNSIQSAHAALRNAGVEQNKEWYLLLDATGTEDIQREIGARVTQLGDKEQANGFGYFADFAGFKVREANQSLTWTGEVTLGANPSNGDTLVIDGVTFTFVTTIGTTAGNVLIGASADATSINLAALINAPTATTAQGVALSTADALKFIDESAQAVITAVAGTGKADLTSVKGRITVTETFTSGSNGVVSCYLHCPFGKKGAIDLVVQKDIATEMSRMVGSLKLATVYATHFLWGKKMFTEGAKRSGVLNILTQANTI